MDNLHTFVRLAAITTCALFCVSFNAIGQTVSNEMQAIIRSTLAADGSINKESHRRFWELTRQEFDLDFDLESSEAQSFAKLWREINLGSQSWQIEVWKCARLSNLESSVVETQRLKDLRANMIKNYEAAASSIWGIDAEVFITAFETQWNSTVIPNTRAVLLAASKSDTVLSANGEITQPLTLETIDLTIASIEQSFERGAKLFNPIWPENFSDSKTFIIGRSDMNSLNLVSPIFFELLISSKEPSGTVFWIDEESGKKVVIEVRLKVTDFDIITYHKVTTHYNPVIPASVKKTNWMINRLSLDIHEGEHISRYKEFLAASRVGNVVSEAEFNLQAENAQKEAQARSMMKHLEEQRLYLDRLSKRKF